MHSGNTRGSAATTASISLSTLNLILFERAEPALSLARSDRRSLHILEVLRRREGETFDAGVINGPRGKGTVVAIARETVSLSFAWGSTPPLSAPLTLIVGLPRPQTARALLREMTSLGVAEIHFVTTEKGDPNYGLSTLWHGGEWHRHLLAGAEQAFCTRVPAVTFGRTLGAVVTTTTRSSRIALDNYESSSALNDVPTLEPAVTLAVGPERGWSAAERNLLREENFVLAHLGSRVLRTETACIAALTLVKAKLGWL